jgi:hypothetical protein
VTLGRLLSVINQHKGKDIRLPQRLGYSWRSITGASLDYLRL